MQQPLNHPVSRKEQAQPSAAQLPPSAQVVSMMNGMVTFHTIRIAAKYNLAGIIEAHGSLTVEELAEQTGTHAFSLFRLLQALASIGIFQEVNPEAEDLLQVRFAQSELSRVLVPGLPESIYDAALFLNTDWHQRSWNILEHSIATGEPGLRISTGKDLWGYLHEHPDEQDLFQRVMSLISRQLAAAVLQVYDFSPYERLMDVAGGRGTLLLSILRAYPHLVGTLFDQSEVIELARAVLLQDSDLARRCELVSGNFFQTGALPPGGDCYCLEQILHDWNDEHCEQILHNIREAIHPQGRLLILERVVEPGPGSAPNKFFDLEMLVLLEGQERTPREYERLLQASGFRLSAIRPTPSTFSIVEGIPV
jgi:ubiquinone/menaquinone biosynthesis C-methylase UbiE